MRKPKKHEISEVFKVEDDKRIDRDPIFIPDCPVDKMVWRVAEVGLDFETQVRALRHGGLQAAEPRSKPRASTKKGGSGGNPPK